MFLGFTPLDAASTILLIIAIFLLRNQDKKDLKRLVEVVLSGVIVTVALYEAGRLYLAPSSVDYVSLLCYRAFVVTLLAKLTEEQWHSPAHEFASLWEKIVYLVFLLASVVCFFFTFLLHA